MTEGILMYIPLASAIFTFFLALFVFIRGKKTKSQLLFFLISSSFVSWFFATFKMLISKTEAEILFWDRINYITAIFGPILLYHFGLEFTNLYNKPRKRLLIVGYVLAFIFLLLLRTNYFVNGVYKYSWGGHAKAAIAHHPFMVYFIFYMILFFFILYDGYKKTRKEPIKNTQIKYLLLGFGLFSIIASPAFLPAYGISVYPFEYIAGVMFVIITAVGVTRHFLFGIRVILTEFLVGVMWLTLSILPFLIEPFKVRIISIGIFSLSLIFGWLLIRDRHFFLISHFWLAFN
jgi:nitrate reductase NapE component